MCTASRRNPVCLYLLQANLALNHVASYDILPAAVLGATTLTEFRINYRNLMVGIAGTIPEIGGVGGMSSTCALSRSTTSSRSTICGRQTSSRWTSRVPSQRPSRGCRRPSSAFTPPSWWSCTGSVQRRELWPRATGRAIHFARPAAAKSSIRRRAWRIGSPTLVSRSSPSTPNRLRPGNTRDDPACSGVFGLPRSTGFSPKAGRTPECNSVPAGETVRPSPTPRRPRLRRTRSSLFIPRARHSSGAKLPTINELAKKSPGSRELG